MSIFLSKQNHPILASAKATGDGAVASVRAAGEDAVAKTKEFNEEHKILESVKDAAAGACSRVDALIHPHANTEVVTQVEDNKAGKQE
mmetsp:Transcript_57121/g.119464  ORF Transcript_57121/g.119464 Transcript_57121/m.119464 type:complete len:88 (-) Transcript_57121:89-352(-)